MSTALAEKSPQNGEARTIVADGLMTVTEAAEYLSISRSKLYQMMDSGELPYVKLGRCRRIQRRDLIDLVSRQLRGGYRK
jgi:excisionase family DNA binding protein